MGEETAIEKAATESVQHMRGREQFTAQMGMAKTFWKSGLYPECENAAQAFVKIQTGVELGIQPAAAMRQIYVIPNKNGFTISLAADLMKGLVKKHGDVTFEYDQGDGYCELTATRNDTGEQFNTRWDRERAESIRQGNYGLKHNWETHEQEMLRHRCDAEACRALCPEIVGGLYSPEEAEEISLIEKPRQPADNSGDAKSDLHSMIEGDASDNDQGDDESGGQDDTATDKQLSSLHALGAELYGSQEKWDQKRPQLVAWASKERTQHSSELTKDECSTLIGKLKEHKEAMEAEVEEVEAEHDEYESPAEDDTEDVQDAEDVDESDIPF